MTIRQRWHSFPGTVSYVLAVAVAAVFSLQGFGCACALAPNPNGEFTLRGTVLNANTLDGLGGALIDARLITGGEQTTRDDLKVPFSAGDGAFEARLTVKGSQCGRVLNLPTPDQLKVIVTIDECEQTFLIDINEDTVVDLDFPDRVIELKEPILVSDCG